MSGLDTLRRTALQAAAKLRDAEAAAEAEAAAVAERNAERTAAFWSDAPERCAAASQAADRALSEVRDLVRAGDPAAALNAYASYRKEHAVFQRLGSAAQWATATWRNDRDEPCDQFDLGARRVTPPGVPGDARLSTKPLGFAQVLEVELDAAAETGAAKAMADMLAPLEAQLERETNPPAAGQ